MPLSPPLHRGGRRRHTHMHSWAQLLGVNMPSNPVLLCPPPRTVTTTLTRTCPGTHSQPQNSKRRCSCPQRLFRCGDMDLVHSREPADGAENTPRCADLVWLSVPCQCTMMFGRSTQFLVPCWFGLATEDKGNVGRVWNSHRQPPSPGENNETGYLRWPFVQA